MGSGEGVGGCCVGCEGCAGASPVAEERDHQPMVMSARIEWRMDLMDEVEDEVEMRRTKRAEV